MRSGCRTCRPAPRAPPPSTLDAARGAAIPPFRRHRSPDPQVTNSPAPSLTRASDRFAAARSGSGRARLTGRRAEPAGEVALEIPLIVPDPRDVPVGPQQRGGYAEFRAGVGDEVDPVRP